MPTELPPTKRAFCRNQLKMRLYSYNIQGFTTTTMINKQAKPRFTTTQPIHLSEAKALRPHARSNFPTSDISFCTTKKIKWLILFVNVMKSTLWLLCSIFYFHLAAN